MIAGSLSFSSGMDTSVAADQVIGLTGSEGLVFHPVSFGSFNGGYFLHPALPYREPDVLFIDRAGDILVLLSGVFFNIDKLSEEPVNSAHVSFPGLAARLFLKEGPGFVSRLNGDFVIFIYQPELKLAYLFRDHAGIRPLACTCDGETLTFSSDIDGLCRAVSGCREPDTEYLLGYFKYIDYRRTACERVKKLANGSYLEFSEQGVKTVRYWFPEKIRTDRRLTYDRMKADLGLLLADAAAIRCDKRFHAGAHVSSGIDSGYIAAMVRRQYADQAVFYGFSWSPDGFVPARAENDEREIVRSFCSKTGISPVFSDMGWDDFSRIIDSYFINHAWFSEDRVIAQAAARGTNLLFSGWGGDEFISTGDRGIELDLLRELRLGLFFRRSRISQPKKFIRDQFFYVINPALGILGRSISKSFRDDARYIKRKYSQSDRGALRNFYFHTSRRQLHLRLLEFYHLQERCESWYLMGYRKGVEYRFPLLDRRIIEYMLKVPTALLCRTGHFRPLLRDLGGDLVPEEVRWNLSKNDPVYWEWMDGLFREAATGYMSESDSWKQNPDLFFVNFNLLKEDIQRHFAGTGTSDRRVLYRALVYIKAIHEYTKWYNGNR